MYVAVVYRAENSDCSNDPLNERLAKRLSSRGDGDWSCFVAEDKDEAIRRALEATRHWEDNSYEKHNGRGYKYRVLVGTLTEEAKVPLTYEVVKL